MVGKAGPPGKDTLLLDDPHFLAPPGNVAGGPYEHRFVDGICRVCGWREGAGENGCPWNVGTVFTRPAARRAR